MNIKFIITLTLVMTTALSITFAQINYSANDTIVPYNSNVIAGTNLGYYEGWTDEQLAEISIGKSKLNIPGVGIQTIRPTLPEYFLEQWGYDIRVKTFQYYKKLGLDQLVCFLEHPTDEHRSKDVYCNNDETPSVLFENIYEPIWLNYEQKIVNPNNYYAHYVAKTLEKYGEFVRIWEIWNEPDYSYSENSMKLPGEEGNWWDNDPNPCDYKLKAPIQHYIRTLRISYEVIKTLDPNALVAVGGLGYPSFLDAILRNTDNPNQGIISDSFPLKGGAYFDVLSFHSYPHIDGSLKKWNNDKQDFDYFRHSDACIDGYIRLRNEFRDVLKKHNYNDIKYPKKHWIVTEINIPRKQFGDSIGSELAQVNFLIKTLVKSKMEDIKQVHVFSLCEAPSSENNENEFSYMGLYQKIKEVKPYNQIENRSGVGFRSAARWLKNSTYNKIATEKLNLPDNMDGGVFTDEDGINFYILWSRTHRDRSETSSFSYSFPEDIGTDLFRRETWDYTLNGNNSFVGRKNNLLTATPVFFYPTNKEVLELTTLELFIRPNPIVNNYEVKYTMPYKTNLSIKLYNSNGQYVETLVDDQPHEKGIYQVFNSMRNYKPGVYYILFQTSNDVISKKIVHFN